MKQDQKLIIQISKELIDKVDDYRFTNRIHSRAEAVRQLIEKALGSPKKGSQKKAS